VAVDTSTAAPAEVARNKDGTPPVPSGRLTGALLLLAGLGYVVALLLPWRGPGRYPLANLAGTPPLAVFVLLGPVLAALAVAAWRHPRCRAPLAAAVLGLGLALLALLAAVPHLPTATAPVPGPAGRSPDGGHFGAGWMVALAVPLLAIGAVAPMAAAGWRARRVDAPFRVPLTLAVLVLAGYAASVWWPWYPGAGVMACPAYLSGGAILLGVLAAAVLTRAHQWRLAGAALAGCGCVGGLVALCTVPAGYHLGVGLWLGVGAAVLSLPAAWTVARRSPSLTAPLPTAVMWLLAAVAYVVAVVLPWRSGAGVGDVIRAGGAVPLCFLIVAPLLLAASAVACAAGDRHAARWFVLVLGTGLFAIEVAAAARPAVLGGPRAAGVFVAIAATLVTTAAPWLGRWRTAHGVPATGRDVAARVLIAAGGVCALLAACVPAVSGDPLRAPTAAVPAICAVLMLAAAAAIAPGGAGRAARAAATVLTCEFAVAGLECSLGGLDR